MDLRRILPVVAGFGLLMAGGLSYGGPDTQAGEPGSKQVWGDPEEEDEYEDGWTWFGMGYEHRNRTWDPVDDPLGGSIDSTSGGKKKEKR